MKGLNFTLLLLLIHFARGQDLFPVQVGQQYGYINSNGKIMIDARYEKAYDFEGAFALVEMSNNTLSFIDKKANIVVAFLDPAPYKRYKHRYSEGLVAIYDHHTDRYGFVDQEGRWIIKPRFYKVKPFSNDLAAVWEDPDIYLDEEPGCETPIPHPKWGYIDKSGNYAFQKMFSSADNFTDGFAVVNDNGYFFINKNGTHIPDDKIKEPSVHLRRLAFDLEFLTDQDNHKHILNSPENYSTDGTLTSAGMTIGFLDHKGTWKIEPIFTSGQFFSEGLAGVKGQNGLWGFINSSGKMIIKPQFQFAYMFSEGACAVKLGVKWGFINNKGKLVIEPIFDKSARFKDGLALVVQNGVEGYINAKGKFVWRQDQQ